MKCYVLGLVHKGANLTIHVILDQLERFKKRYKRFPKILYIQFDGGPENANDEVVGFMELLVALRIVPEIYLSRLPVGHTHEDIDAMFGIMWVSFRLKPCLTLEDYKQGIIDCFAGGDRKIEADVEDINIVPNYVAFITPNADKMARWAKEQLTVHQIHISACQPSVYFPYGYFIRYRDYCSDQVVELKHVDKRNAITMIGHLTGIDPVTHNSKWFPDENTYDFRPVCGIYNLKRIMFTDPERGIRPIDFRTDDITAMETIKQSIVGSLLFPSGSSARTAWVLWFQSVLPIGNSISGEEYIQNHEYKQPLKDYLCGKIVCHLSVEEIDALEEARQKSTPMGFEFPTDIVSYATPHVNLTQWKNLVIPPRQYKYLSEYVQNLTKVFQESTNDKYYRGFLDSCTIDKLQGILARRLNTQGRHEPLNGTKRDLISRIFTGDYEAFSNLYHPIRDKEQAEMVHAYWNDSVELEEVSVDVERTSKVYNLSRALNSTTGSIHTDTFLKILALIRAQDTNKKQAYSEYYSKASESKKYGGSIILSPQFASNFFILEDFEEARLSNFVDIEDSAIFRVYMPVKSDCSLVVLDISAKEFWYFNADINVSTIEAAKAKANK